MPAIHPVVDEGLGNSAYVVELGDGLALVVDPARDPTPYLELARWRRLRIVYAVETHLHADFLTGSRELAAAEGAQVLAPRKSRLGFGSRQRIEARLRATDHRQCHDPVERDHRPGRDPSEQLVQAEDLPPVRRFGRRRLVVDRRDGGLQLVRADRRRGE